MQQILTNRLNDRYMNDHDEHVLPGVATFDRLVTRAVRSSAASTEEGMSETERASCASFVESRLFNTLLELHDQVEDQQDALLEHYDHDEERRKRREREADREAEYRDAAISEASGRAAELRARAPPPPRLAAACAEVSRMEARLQRQYRILSGESCARRMVPHPSDEPLYTYVRPAWALAAQQKRNHAQQRQRRAVSC